MHREGRRLLLRTPRYSSLDVEQSTLSRWRPCVSWRADLLQPASTRFSLVFPPPNITGSLHLGHALTAFVQDALIRWRRMRGFETVWVPGIDHAGIATESVVSRKLGGRGDDRDAFVKRVEEWKTECESGIRGQLSRLGLAFDWERFVWTLDEKRSAAVDEAFVRLFEQGKIYRRERLVNWCVALSTVLSDVEVETVERDGEMYRFRYPLVEGAAQEFLPVMTTRPETIWGDTAVAVHPQDERFNKFIGRMAMNPMNGTLIPVIGDAELVDMNLGTGVVKVTPAHDFNDYECALRHNLEMRNIMNDDGTMNDVCGVHSNLDRFEARNRVIQTLDKDGLFIGKERKVMRVATCSRSGDIIEPLLKPQWFLNCSEMAKNAADAVRRGELVIVPEFHKHTWFQFLDNIQDWCISRQLWWGHRLPLYQVHFHDQRPQEWVAAKSEKEAAFKVTEKYNIDSTKFYLERDPDVLDTWFSSGLFPISSFGWPQETEDLEKYYPLSLMETGSDILFFWVARMVMLCTHMTGKLPFNKIFLHPMVRDSQGLKMSKSLGNVIDPVEIIEGRSLDQLKERILKSNVSKTELKRALKRVEKDFPNGIPQCGTDALRLALCSYLEQGRQINLDIQRVITQRNFCNKLWQATRFCVMNMEKDCVSLDAEKLDEIDCWILIELSDTCQNVNVALEELNFSGAVQQLQDFFISSFCDVYIELCKPDLRSGEKRSNKEFVLWFCLNIYLRLLHPFAPFVTDELWQVIQQIGAEFQSVEHGFLINERFPSSEEVVALLSSQTKIESSVGRVEAFLGILRRIRSVLQDEAKMFRRKDIYLLISSPDDVEVEFLEHYKAHLTHLLQVSEISLATSFQERPDLYIIQDVRISDTINLRLLTTSDSMKLRDSSSDVAKLEKQLDRLLEKHRKFSEKLASPDFLLKSPPEIQSKTRQMMEKLSEEISVLRSRMN